MLAHELEGRLASSETDESNLTRGRAEVTVRRVGTGPYAGPAVDLPLVWAARTTSGRRALAALHAPGEGGTSRAGLPPTISHGPTPTPVEDAKAALERVSRVRIARCEDPDRPRPHDRRVAGRETCTGRQHECRWKLHHATRLRAQLEHPVLICSLLGEHVDDRSGACRKVPVLYEAKLDFWLDGCEADRSASRGHRWRIDTIVVHLCRRAPVEGQDVRTILKVRPDGRTIHLVDRHDRQGRTGPSVLVELDDGCPWTAERSAVDPPLFSCLRVVLRIVERPGKVVDRFHILACLWIHQQGLEHEGQDDLPGCRGVELEARIVEVEDRPILVDEAVLGLLDTGRQESEDTGQRCQ